jgi:hypothetical protein
LSELVGQVLLAQAAYANGFTLDENDLAARIAELWAIRPRSPTGSLRMVMTEVVSAPL